MRLEITKEQADQLQREGKAKLVHVETKYYVDVAQPTAKASTNRRPMVQAHQTLRRAAVLRSFHTDSITSKLYEALDIFMPINSSMKRETVVSKANELMTECTREQVTKAVSQFIKYGILEPKE